MIAQELEVSLHMAFVEARQQRHEFITVEHLLLALLDNPSAAEVLRACSANIDDLRSSLANFIKDNTPQVAGTDEVDTQPTLGFQRVIQRAILHVQSSGKKEVTGANVLVANSASASPLPSPSAPSLPADASSCACSASSPLVLAIPCER